MSLVNSFTSTGEKLYWHQEAMAKLRSGKGMPIVTHVLPNSNCNAKCAFCSVGERPTETMPFAHLTEYLDQLELLGLKAVIISGGGNPILYRDKVTGQDFNNLVDNIHRRGLQIGLITNGMPLSDYPQEVGGPRKSWRAVRPETLDKLTWCRISMAGLDANHKEQEVFVPDFDYSKTSLGFSWIMSDAYEEPTHKHGWVSTPQDIRTPNDDRAAVFAVDRLPWIEEQIKAYVEKYHPTYVRLLCNCLEPEKIPLRHRILSEMAARINPDIVFSQNKPPRQPRACYKGYPHPVLNTDGYVYPCDSVVLNQSAGHKFAHDWRICRYDEIGEFYARPIKPNVPNTICSGCVFSDQVDLLAEVVNGAPTPAPAEKPIHENFV